MQFSEKKIKVTVRQCFTTFFISRTPKGLSDRLKNPFINSDSYTQIFIYIHLLNSSSNRLLSVKNLLSSTWAGVQWKMNYNWLQHVGDVCDSKYNWPISQSDCSQSAVGWREVASRLVTCAVTWWPKLVTTTACNQSPRAKIPTSFSYVQGRCSIFTLVRRRLQAFPSALHFYCLSVIFS